MEYNYHIEAFSHEDEKKMLDLQDHLDESIRKLQDIQGIVCIAEFGLASLDETNIYIPSLLHILKRELGGLIQTTKKDAMWFRQKETGQS